MWLGCSAAVWSGGKVNNLGGAYWGTLAASGLTIAAPATTHSSASLLKIRLTNAYVGFLRLQ